MLEAASTVTQPTRVALAASRAAGWTMGECPRKRCIMQITVGELLDHPGARAVFQRRFPMLMKHPMLGAARTITLEQILSVAQAYVPQKKIDETLSELRRA
ncbi:Uncharacterised protein [Flavonifractor plautii]|uniref:Uncharacterized protein n=1 Tax=Flavonifractor plautii TaxID=292800 RepID=A0A174VQV5_FLAPL|nr:Uncharacterised protein [Flavonifractor plautii]